LTATASVWKDRRMRGPVDVVGALLVAAACSGPPTDSATPIGAGAGAGAGSGTAAPTTGSGTAAPTTGAAADPSAVRIPSPVPSGDIRITYACSHSAKPFGSTHWSQTTVFDLATGRATTDRSEGDDDDPDKTRSTHVETILPPERVATIRASLAKVLAGGPYRPDVPVPEGVSCTLSLWVPGEKAFFTIEKATTADPDAVSQLVRDLGS
jgi:hypothetical protein